MTEEDHTIGKLNRELNVVRQLLGNAQKTMATTIAELSYASDAMSGELELARKETKIKGTELLELERKLELARRANSELSTINQNLSERISKQSAKVKPLVICELTSNCFDADDTEFDIDSEVEFEFTARYSSGYSVLSSANAILKVTDVFDNSYTAVERNKFIDNLLESKL